MLNVTTKLFKKVLTHNEKRPDCRSDSELLLLALYAEIKILQKEKKDA